MRKLVWLSISLVILGVLLATLVVVLPPQFDTDNLIAPPTIEEFFPVEHPTDRYMQIFGAQSDLFASDFEAIEANLDSVGEGQLNIVELKEKTIALRRAVAELGRTGEWDVPHLPRVGDVGDSRKRYAYKSLITGLSDADELDDGVENWKFLQRSMERSKNIASWVTTMGTMGAIQPSIDLGVGDARRFILTWRESLGRSAQLDYYFVEQFPLSDEVLIQKNRTLNKLWLFYEDATVLLQKGELKKLEDRSEELQTDPANWSPLNYNGRLVFKIVAPSFSKLYRVGKTIEERLIEVYPELSDLVPEAD